MSTLDTYSVTTRRNAPEPVPRRQLLSEALRQARQEYEQAREAVSVARGELDWSIATGSTAERVEALQEALTAARVLEQSAESAYYVLLRRSSGTGGSA